MNDTMSRSTQAVGLLGWIMLTSLAAALGGIASASAGTFYAELVRPEWSPPGWLFGPVWTVLYLMMGVSAWLVWRGRGFAGARAALWWFIAQLAVNTLWSWLFFAWRQGGSALADIIVLWVLIVVTVVQFRRLSPTAAWLLLPYLAWVSFAMALNFSVWRLNPALLG